jgi:hypothetical protein
MRRVLARRGLHVRVLRRRRRAVIKPCHGERGSTDRAASKVEPERIPMEQPRKRLLGCGALAGQMDEDRRRIWNRRIKDTVSGRREYLSRIETKGLEDKGAPNQPEK